MSFQDPAELTESLRSMVLHKLWQHWQTSTRGGRSDEYFRPVEERMLLSALNLGYDQIYHYLSWQNPTYVELLEWAKATAGELDDLNLARLAQHLIPGFFSEKLQAWQSRLATAPDVLNTDELAHWQREGYVILRQAISPEHAARCADLVWQAIQANPDDMQSWYTAQGRKLMLAEYQHRYLDENRQNFRIHKAFSQLWGRTDLWPSCDRLGFNAPEKFGHQFSSSGLHWDVSLVQPIPFSTQALIYLSDTAADQGALSLVPGFHTKIDDWLAQLPASADPRQQDLHALGPQCIAANAGDMIIWHQALPHAASPNRSEKARLTHYLNLQAIDLVEQTSWR